MKTILNIKDSRKQEDKFLYISYDTDVLDSETVVEVEYQIKEFADKFERVFIKPAALKFVE